MKYALGGKHEMEFLNGFISKEVVISAMIKTFEFWLGLDVADREIELLLGFFFLYKRLPRKYC